MTITAKVHNHTITLPADLAIEEGAEVQVVVPEARTVMPTTPGNALAWMARHAGCVDGPEDFAAEHDHYVHGTPKRTGL